MGIILRFSLRSVNFKQYVQWENLTVPRPDINNQNCYLGLYCLRLVSEIF